MRFDQGHLHVSGFIGSRRFNGHIHAFVIKGGPSHRPPGPTKPTIHTKFEYKTQAHVKVPRRRERYTGGLY